MEHVCFGVAKPGVRERFPRLIDVLLTLSTCRCVIPSVPDVVVRQLRILTFASPSVFAISASVPGRFSWEILKCLTFGMAGTPREGVRGVDVPRILLSSEQRVKLREWLVVGYFDLCCVASGIWTDMAHINSDALCGRIAGFVFQHRTIDFCNIEKSTSMPNAVSIASM